MPAKKNKKPAPSTKGDNSQLALIRQLADVLNATGLTEIELDHKGARVRVSKSVTVAASVAAAPAPVAYATAPIAAAPVAAPPAAPPGDSHPGALKSPMVGTAYLAASPGAPPFVAVGDTVKQGQTVLIIEAMKTMNQITAPRAGKVTALFIENGQPVEFGEALLVIE